MQLNVTHPSQLNEPGPRTEGSLRSEDERSRNKRDQGQCNGTGQWEQRGAKLQTLQALRSTLTNDSRRKTMSHIYNFFDNHMEVWGAVVFGLLAIGACVAMAAALNGAM